jgi:mono/diheme cytochrome c family protein
MRATKTVLSTFLIVAVSALPALAQDKALVAQGEKIYNDQKCFNCHSIRGDGNKKGPLDKIATKVKPAEMREWLTNATEMAAKMKKDRKPPMKSATLTDGEMTALLAYLQTLK